MSVPWKSSSRDWASLGKQEAGLVKCLHWTYITAAGSWDPHDTPRAQGPISFSQALQYNSFAIYYSVISFYCFQHSLGQHLIITSSSFLILKTLNSWRDGPEVKNTLLWEDQCLGPGTHRCLWLHLQETLHPSISSVGTCPHTHTQINLNEYL